MYLFLFLFCGERTAQFVGESNALVTKNNRERRTIMGGRRKNPNPKRAENARTVLKSEYVLEKRGGEEEEEEEPDEVLLCLRIPDEDEVNEQMRKEEMTVRKGAKRKRGQQHECGVCEKVFVSASKLAIHVRIHTNERPYECDVCEKCFRDSSDLKKHMRIHTKEKPYECDVCEMRFRESGTLKAHMRIHTNEKPYECDVCDKAFRDSSTLKSTCVFTRTRNRMNVMCARSVFVILVI